MTERGNMRIIVNSDVKISDIENKDFEFLEERVKDFTITSVTRDLQNIEIYGTGPEYTAKIKLYNNADGKLAVESSYEGNGLEYMKDVMFSFKLYERDE